MSEFLTVRLSREKEKPVNWLVWSVGQQEVIASGELSHHDQIEELADYARQRTTIVLLDGSDVKLSEVEIPAGASRQLENMLPFIMEDDIAQDVESLHFHIMKRTASLASVAVVESQYIKYVLGLFSRVGIEVRKVLPDVLTLPLEDESISAVQIDNQWLFRKDMYRGLVVDQEWLPQFLLSDWRETEEVVKPIISYTPAPSLGDNEADWREAEPELVMEILAKGAIHSAVNLLSGPFKLQSSLLKNLKVWRNAGIAACLFLLISGVQSFIDINRSMEQASAYRDESERIFRVIFPDKKKIPTVSYLKRQMTNEEKRLQGSDTEGSVFNWLTRLPQALEKQSQVKFNSLRYDAGRGEIRIEATMKDFQAFEVVRKKLDEHFSVTQGPLDREGDKVSGSFVLRRK